MSCEVEMKARSRPHSLIRHGNESFTLLANDVSFKCKSLTVQLYFMQSSQKRLAENFLLTTTVSPFIRLWPTPMMLPGKVESFCISCAPYRCRAGKKKKSADKKIVSLTCRVIERKTVIDYVIRAHTKSIVAESSDSVVPVEHTVALRCPKIHMRLI